MRYRKYWHLLPLLCLAAMAAPAAAPSMDELRNADYMRGKNAFQGRCSACHTLADSSSNIAGPNLWKVFDRVAGSKSDFSYSAALKQAGFRWSPERLDAWLADPAGYLPGNIMGIPESVPDEDRVHLIAFVMIETGAVDWPRPATAFSAAEADASRSPAERWPSFWNHLMFNTTRYRWVDEGEEFLFDAYFKTDGSVVTNQKGVEGFWRINERSFFCYALTGLPVGVGSMVECFPVAAMAIPRFADELWVSNPQGDVRLHGGMVPGRPDWVYGNEPPTPSAH